RPASAGTCWGAAGNVLAFAAMTLRLHDWLAVDLIADLAAIASAFEFHGSLLRLLNERQDIAAAVLHMQEHTTPRLAFRSADNRPAACLESVVQGLDVARRQGNAGEPTDESFRSRLVVCQFNDQQRTRVEHQNCLVE